MISGLITTAASMPVDIAKTRFDVLSLVSRDHHSNGSDIHDDYSPESLGNMEMSVREFNICWEKSEID